jgi:hypothetical protein
VYDDSSITLLNYSIGNGKLILLWVFLFEYMMIRLIECKQRLALAWFLSKFSRYDYDCVQMIIEYHVAFLRKPGQKSLANKLRASVLESEY